MMMMKMIVALYTQSSSTAVADCQTKSTDLVYKWLQAAVV